MARRVGASQKSSRDGGMDVPVCVASFLICAILPQDFDPARIVGHDDDVAVRMRGARDVCRRFLRLFAGAGVAVRVAVLLCRRVCCIHQGHWWRIADIINRVFRETQDLSGPCRGHYGRCHHGRMGLENLDRAFIHVLLDRSSGPDISPAILAPADDMFPVIAEGSADLTARVLVAPIFRFEVAVSEVVESHSRIVAGDQELRLRVRVVGRESNSVDTRDLAALGITAARGPNVDLLYGL